MRIAHVSDCYLPRTGGIEHQVRDLAHQQAASGDGVRIITATRSNGHRDDVQSGVPVHRVAMPIPFDLPIHPRPRSRVRQLLCRFPVDVVHIHVGIVSPFAWGAVRATRDLGVPTLITVHSLWGRLAQLGFAVTDPLCGWSRWRVRWSAVSAAAADRIHSVVRPGEHVLLIPNGINPSEWTVGPAPGDDDTIEIVTVLRLAPRKRFIPFLRIVGAVRRQLNHNVRLRVTIVGDGPGRALAEGFARRHGLVGTVRFTGSLAQTDIRAVFAQAHIYVQPSVREAFGLAALEARTAGLPIVARTGTGTAELVRDGVQGLLADDDEGMARAIVRLIAERDLRARISQHNRTTPPREAWASVLAIVRDAYAGILSYSFLLFLLL